MNNPLPKMTHGTLTAPRLEISFDRVSGWRAGQDTTGSGYRPIESLEIRKPGRPASRIAAWTLPMS